MKETVLKSIIEFENPRALLEELSLFRKEQREAAQIDLLIVGFDLD